MDLSPGQASVASADWDDGLLQSQLCSQVAGQTDRQLDEALALVMEVEYPDVLDIGASKGTPEKDGNTDDHEKAFSPICGVESHEEGVRILRAALAAAGDDPAYALTEQQDSHPLWGSNDDWALMRPELLHKLSPTSAELPEKVMAVPASLFRDLDFALPDPVADCVLVSGGVDNTQHEGANGGCHFMPLLAADLARAWRPHGPSHPKWRDMVDAVEGRSHGFLLLDWVRAAGDCFFHSLLIALHFKNVILCAKPSECTVTPPPQASQLAATMGPSPTSTQSPDCISTRRGLCFEDALAEEEKGSGTMADPMETILPRLRGATSWEAFEDLLFHDRMFDGFRNKDETYTTVKANVKDAWEDARTHRQLAADIDFDIRMCAVLPIAEAVHTVAKAKGIQTEALLACIESNIGFLEAAGTMLSHNLRSKHFITPGSAVIVGSPSSSRKTALIKDTNEWMCGPEAFQDQAVLTTDSTTKGIRNCLKDHGRCAVCSDEAANTFETKLSDKEAGIHFISMTKLNTWTQGEFDGPTTGNGSFSLEKYNFMLKVAGQLEVVEEIVQPRVHGFQKRFKQVWGLAELHTQDEQLFAESEGLIKRWHEWMYKNFASQPPNNITLSGQALSMYNAAKQAVTDFIAETKLPPVYKTKLMFFHSDVLRDAHKVFRSTQFVASFFKGCSEGASTDRLEMSLDEFTVALHKWIVQLRWHFASYRFAGLKKDEAASGAQRAQDFKAGLCSVPDAADDEPKLATTDLFMRTFMSRCPADSWFTSADARMYLKNLRGTNFRENLREKIDKAIQHLLEHGLLEAHNSKMKKDEARQPEKESGKLTSQAAKRLGNRNTPGRACQTVRKRSLHAIQEDPRASEEQKRLRLSSNDFPAGP